MATQAQQDALVKLVVGMFGAAPGSVYLNQLSQSVDAYAAIPGVDPIRAVANDLTGTGTFQTSQFYPSFLSNEQFATRFIENLVGSTVTDADAIAWAESWVVGLLNSGLSRGDAIYFAVAGLDAVPAEDEVWGAASQAFDNQFVVAQYYTVDFGGNATDISALQSVVANVDQDTDVSTPEAILAIIETSGGATGGSFVLTPNDDFADSSGSIRNVTPGGASIPSDFKFTNANEVVTGGATWTGGDVLLDASKSDNDVFNFAMTDGSLTAVLVAPGPPAVFENRTADGTLANIETWNVTASNTVAAVIDLTNVSGLKTLNISGSPGGPVTVGTDTLVADSGVSMVNASGITSAQAFTLDASGSTASQDMNIRGASVGVNTITGADGNDVITGGSAGDTLSGDAGNDTINGGGGADILNGGSGDDILNGGGGDDTINTGTGKDVVTGGGGDDIVNLDNTPNAANSERVVFEASASDNGSDDIFLFVAGSLSSGGDVLDVSAFLGAEVAYTEISSLVDNNVAASNVVVITDGTFAAADANNLVLGASANYVFLELAGTQANLWYMTTDTNGDITNGGGVGQQVAEISDAATLAGATFADLTGFDAANFA